MDLEFGGVLDALADAVVAADATGAIRYVNRAAECLLGYAPGELIGQPLTTIMPPRLHDAHITGFRRFLTTRQPTLIGRAVRVPALRRDGGEIEIELTLAALRVGEEDLFVGSLRDLTDRVELERQLAVTGYLRSATAAAGKLTSHLDLEQVLQTVVDTLVADFDAALARIWLYDAATNTLNLRASGGLSRETTASGRARIDLETYPYKVGEVARTGKPFIQNGLRGDPQFEEDWVERERLASVAILPLLIAGELRGVLAYFSRQELREEVVDVLVTFTAMVTAALNDVQLFHREQVARATAERERDFVRMVLDHAPIGITVSEGPEHRLVMVNPAARAVVGTGSEETVGRSMADIAPEAARAVKQLLDQVYQTGQPVVVPDHRVPLPDGGAIDAHLVFAPVPGPEGQPAGVILMALDLTERKRAEEARHASEEWLSTTLRSIGDAVIATDHQGRVVFMNPVAEEMTGWKQEEAKGRALAGVFHIINEDTRQTVEDPVARVLRDGLTVGLANHTLLTHRSGREIPIDDSGAPIRDQAGNIIGVVLTFHDITERRRAEQGWRHIAARARCILWHADIEERGVPALHWDLKLTDEEAARRFFPVDTPPGKSYIQAWVECRVPEDLSHIREHSRRAIRAGQGYRQEYRCRRADGAIRWLWEDVQIETVAPGRWRAVGVCTDITERKELEEALQKRVEELAEADRRKADYLSMLAHELRNPLAPILNAAEIVKRLDPEEPRLRRAQATIERQVKHLARLIEDLLSVTRITHGKIVLRREPFDLAHLVREIAEDERDTLTRAGLTLSVEVPAEPVTLEGDAPRVAQVLGNLLQNAAKFTQPGGAVRVRLEVDPQRGRALVTVRDTGIGIPPDVLPHIFETFTQADRSLDRSRGGLGLGLALVKGLVELHGGEVRAESEGPGRGAAFTFWLPLSGQPAAERLPAAAPPASFARRVLVVEDNRDAAETLRDLLEMAGHTVEVALTGPAGVEAARRFRPEVVLCDLGLPGMDGYRVAMELRREPETASARLVVVSGYGEEEDSRRAREAGFVDHLTKPVNPEDLARVLEAGPANI